MIMKNVANITKQETNTCNGNWFVSAKANMQRLV